MKLYYFREFQEITPPGETEKVRLSEITLLERLAFSAYFTALKSNKKSIDFEEIIFGDNVSRGNLEDTVRMLSHLLKTRVNVCHWIKQNFDKVNKDGNAIIHTIEINTDNIFTTRLGKTQKSIANVAFRAFVLASAKSRCKGKNPLLDTIPIHNWIDASVSSLREADEKVKNNVIYNAPRIRRYIQMWLDSTGVEAHFKDKMTLKIDGMKQKPQKIDNVKEDTEPKKLFDSIEQQKFQTKPEREAEEEECKGVDKGFNNYCKERGIIPELEIDMTSTKTTYPKNSVQWKIQNILNMDPVKFQDTREELSSLVGKNGTSMIYDKISVKIYDKLSAIAKKYKIANRDDIKDHFTKGYFLKLPDYSCFIEDLKTTRNWAMSLLSDDEDSRVFEDSNLRKLARLNFVEYFGWMMNIK